MIKTEFYRIREDGARLVRTASTDGFKILQNETGAVYDEAIDLENSAYTYTETDEKIDTDDVDNEEALTILLGGRDDEL